MATAFFEAYQRLCSSAGKSDNAVAAEIGLSNSTVTSWRNGAIPRRPTIKKIADYFGVGVDEAMGYFTRDKKENPPSPKAEGIALDISGLTEENKRKARDYLELLLKSQQNG